MSNKEIYNAIEHEVGISSYLSKEHPGFAAVLKARISDFVVHEGEQNLRRMMQIQKQMMMLYTMNVLIVLVQYKQCYGIDTVNM